jgi:hypothetical protein
MKRRLVWMLAIGGVVWFWLRRGARRPEPVLDVPPTPQPADTGASDPAEELRRKLDEKERGPGEGSDTDPPPAPASVEELDAKRREVHDRAQAAADEMRRTSTD